MKYKEKNITIKIERNIIGNIYRSYVGRKKIATSFWIDVSVQTLLKRLP